MPFCIFSQVPVVERFSLNSHSVCKNEKKLKHFFYPAILLYRVKQAIIDLYRIFLIAPGYRYIRRIPVIRDYD